LPADTAIPLLALERPLPDETVVDELARLDALLHARAFIVAHASQRARRSTCIAVADFRWRDLIVEGRVCSAACERVEHGSILSRSPDKGTGPHISKRLNCINKSGRASVSLFNYDYDVFLCIGVSRTFVL
jgi:hypothetical protein